MISVSNTIARLIKNQEKQGATFLNLMPIENYLSPKARKALSSDCVNRYSLYNTALRVDHGWYTLGEDTILNLENKTDKLLKEMFGAKYLSSRPLSGIQAMEIILFALAGKDYELLSIKKKLGGHSSTTKIAKKLGFETHFIPFDNKVVHKIDFERLELMMDDNKNYLVYLDLSCIIEKVDLKRLRSLLPEGSLICYDGSHVLGLIAGKCFQNPLNEGADLLCGSLHKSFFGPQRATVMTNSNKLWKIIEPSIKIIVSNRHNNDLAALSIASVEMKKYGKKYAKQILRNSKRLSHELDARDFTVLSSEGKTTETHQVWVKLDSDSIKFIERAYKSKLILNRYPLPGSQNPGLRIGVQGVTRLGMTEKDMYKIADILKHVKTGNTKQAKKLVNELVLRYNTVRYC